MFGVHTSLLGSFDVLMMYRVLCTHKRMYCGMCTCTCTCLRINKPQVVRTTGGSETWVPEIQLVGIHLDFAPEIQSFHTTAPPHATVGGSFKIGYPGKGYTLAIPATATADDVQAAIEDMLDVGDVAVTRTPYLYCACNDAYTWHVTFLDLKSPVKQLKVDDAQLNGNGAAVSTVTTVQQAARVRGSFRLILGDAMTRPLAHDVSAKKLHKALEDDLGMESLLLLFRAASYAMTQFYVVVCRCGSGIHFCACTDRDWRSKLGHYVSSTCFRRRCRHSDAGKQFK